MNKADEVLYTLRGIKPPLDAAGRLIQDGDWVVRAVTMGQVSGLQFGRAFPCDIDVDYTQGEDARHTAPDTIKVTVYGIQSDKLAYGLGGMIRGTVSHAHRMFIIDKAQVPEAIRLALSGPREYLETRYKSEVKTPLD